MDPNKKFSGLSNHFDPISDIKHKLKVSPIQWFWRHIKGHQDDHLGPLDRWYSLNVICAKVAKN